VSNLNILFRTHETKSSLQKEITDNIVNVYDTRKTCAIRYFASRDRLRLQLCWRTILLCIYIRLHRDTFSTFLYFAIHCSIIKMIARPRFSRQFCVTLRFYLKKILRILFLEASICSVKICRIC